MRPSVEERDALELVRRANVVLPGLYAWASTVLYPATLHGAPTSARVTAGVAVLPLIGGVIVGNRRPSLGRLLALHGFVAGSVLTWLLVGDLLAVDRLDPIRAALGGTGWVLFAFAWGASREPARIPEDDPHALPGEPLTPRGALPPGASLILAIAMVSAALPVTLAWRVTRPSQALLAHAVAIAAAIALVTSGSRIAVGRGKWTPVQPVSKRLALATVPLAALALLTIIGVIELLS